MNIIIIIKSENYCWLTRTHIYNTIYETITRYARELLELNDPAYCLLAKILIKEQSEIKEYNPVYNQDGKELSQHDVIKFLPELEDSIITLYTYRKDKI